MNNCRLQRAFVVGLVAAVTILVGDPLVVQAVTNDTVFVEEEAYPAGSCFIGKTPALSWAVFVNNKKHTVCCPKNQVPTGKIKATEARCAVPSPPRGNCSPRDAVPTFCTGKVPFKICCPGDMVARCDPNLNNPQCAKSPILPSESQTSIVH